VHKSNRQLIAKTEILAIFPRKKHDTSSYFGMEMIGSAGYEKASLAKILE
jgi:hypothetical protein